MMPRRFTMPSPLRELQRANRAEAARRAELRSAIMQAAAIGLAAGCAILSAVCVASVASGAMQPGAALRLISGGVAALLAYAAFASIPNRS